MAVVGDLFVNVRARTAGLNKGLARARQSLSKFARSGGGLIAGLAAGFGVFKLANVALGAMVYHSDEFRAAWANASNGINKLMQDMGTTLGPILADGVNQLGDWLANSDGIRDAFEGLGILFESVLIPAAKSFFEFMDKASTVIAKVLPNTLTAPVPDRINALGQDVEGMLGGGTFGRAAHGLMDRMIEGTGAGAIGRAIFGGGDSSTTDGYLRQIRDRLEVPR